MPVDFSRALSPRALAILKKVAQVLVGLFFAAFVCLAYFSSVYDVNCGKHDIDTTVPGHTSWCVLRSREDRPDVSFEEALRALKPAR